jgi:hypothetical protein
MDNKKTILVSIITTLATLFVVATLFHLCGNCSKNTCSRNNYHQCASYHKSCHGNSTCDKSEKKCGSSTKCSKEKSCTSKTKCTKGENGEKIIEKTIEIEETK